MWVDNVHVHCAPDIQWTAFVTDYDFVEAHTLYHLVAALQTQNSKYTKIGPLSGQIYAYIFGEAALAADLITARIGPTITKTAGSSPPVPSPYRCNS